MDKINISSFKRHIFFTLVKTELLMSKILESDIQNDIMPVFNEYMSVSKTNVVSLREILKKMKEIYGSKNISKEFADKTFIAVLEEKNSDGESLYELLNCTLTGQDLLNDMVGAVI